MQGGSVKETENVKKLIMHSMQLSFFCYNAILNNKVICN